MIRTAAAYAVAAGIGTVVGTFTGAILGSAITIALVSSNKQAREVVINHYPVDKSDEGGSLQPQDATLNEINLSTPSE